MENEMKSNYAFIYYKKDIKSGDITKNGKTVTLNYPRLAGQLDLLKVPELERIERDFPDCIKGEAIQEGNILNMVKMCYDKLKESIGSIEGIENDEIKEDFQYLENEFMVDGVLTPDHENLSSIEDLANKYINLQRKVRYMQGQKEEQKGINK